MAKIIVQFSGGKDSQACLIWAVEKFGSEKVEAQFSDTVWEHEDTYKHISEICEKMNVKIVTLTSRDFPDGMMGMVKKKGRFPSSNARFCTEELKIKPFIDYVLTLEENLIVIQGIRNEESIARSTMQENCSLFKYYFEPYRTNSMIVEKYKNRLNLSLAQRKSYLKAKERLDLGKEDKKFHTYRKKEIFEWKKKFDDSVLRPIIKWTSSEVIQYILEHGQRVNPLYYKGAKRVGCFPCIMTSKEEIRAMNELSPEWIPKVRDAEKETNSSFFPPDFVPKKHRSQTSKSGKRFGLVDDVLNHLTEFSGTLYDEEEEANGTRKCMSFYSICE